MTGFKWIKPEIYPLFLAMGTAVGLLGFSISRNLASNPDVRINKDDRSAGILDNYNEGKQYKDHALRKWVHGHPPEIMGALNRYFSGSK